MRVSIIIIGLGLVLGSTTHANLLTNGSFEDPDVAPGFCTTYGDGSTAITGWEVTRATVDHCEIWAADDGDQGLDLDGNNNDRGGIKQTFTSDPNQAYEATFSLAGNTDAPPDLKILRVEAAAGSAIFGFESSSTDPNNMGWAVKTFCFTAEDTTTTIEFYSADSLAECGSCAAGPALDNVSVVEVESCPSPPPVPMVPGWALVAMALALLSTGVLLVRMQARRQTA